MHSINIGCGEDTKPGYINTDIRNLNGTDLVCEATTLPFKNNSLNEIIANDVLEHISWRKTSETLKEWKRTLKPGGTLKIKTPNIHTLISTYLNNQIPFEEFIRVTFGNQDYEENTHKTCFHPENLEKTLTNTGFKVMNIEETLPRMDWKNMEIIAEKPVNHA